MKQIQLGNTQASVSQVCLGCMLMGSTIDPANSYGMLDRYMELGGNFLDTADCYAWWVGSGQFVGNESETLLGQWMKERRNRDQIFLATKVGARILEPEKMRNAAGEIQWQRIPAAYELLTPDAIRRGIEGSLRRLQTDHIDLYYAHIDDRATPLEDTLEMFNRLVEEGKVRYIACSNLRTWRLERARSISAAHGWASYVAIQQEYSYLRRKPGSNTGMDVHVDEELLDYLRNNEVALLAYSPLLKGIYDDPVKRQNYYNWDKYNTEDSHVRLETLSRMARELGVSNSQLVIAWLLHRQPVTIPIVSASRMEQFEHNLGALKINLSPEQMEILDQASG
jgi:aryl-alcohol dehydrogenase-like predicted oxidoreductase